MTAGVLALALLSGSRDARAENVQQRWVGTWQLDYTASVSSCPDVKPGQTVSAKLVIKVVGGDLQIVEQTNAGSARMKWHGDATNMVLTGRQNDSSVVMELGMKWTGRRVVARMVKDATSAYACAVMYDAVAKPPAQ